MRKIVVTEFISLDGVIEEPSWSMPYWNDEIAKVKGDEQAACDALLLGRVTYQGFAAAWPSSTDEGADRMNSLPKFVVSTTLEEVAWNNSILIKENIPAEVARLKQQPGQDILVYGSGLLVDTLLQHELVDELHLLVYPVILGRGKRLYKDGRHSSLGLVESRSFSSGVVLLTYQLGQK